MPKADHPAALIAADVPPRTKPSNYPEPFASRMAGRIKRPLGDLFGLRNFGVNLTRLSPGAVSALHHTHSRQDEFIYVLKGHPTLFADAGEVQLQPGMVAGFAAGGTPHHLENRLNGGNAAAARSRQPSDTVHRQCASGTAATAHVAKVPQPRKNSPTPLVAARKLYETLV